LQAIPLLKEAEKQWKQQQSTEATERAKIRVASQLSEEGTVIPMSKAKVEEPDEVKEPLLNPRDPSLARYQAAAAAVLRTHDISTPDSESAREGIELPLQSAIALDACAVCQKHYVKDTDVCRLSCGHTFHTHCWRKRKDAIPRGCKCSICYGPPDEIARFPWAGMSSHVDRTSSPGRFAFSNIFRSSTTAEEIVSDTVQAATTAQEAVSSHIRNLTSPPALPQYTVGSQVQTQIDHFGGGVITPRTLAASDALLDGPLASPSNYDMSLIVLPKTYDDYQSWENKFNIDGREQATNSHTHEEPIPAEIFHTNTQLKDGRPSLLVDPGSKGNLGGEVTVRHHARAAQAAGKQYSSTKRAVPLNVMGVGNGSQQCPFDCTTALGLQRTDGTCVEATYTAPIVPGSDLPALLGLDALMSQRALLDLTTLKLHFVGPGTLQLDLPAGSESFQLEIAPSGHLVLPCGHYPTKQPVLDSKPLTLLTAADSSASATLPTVPRVHSSPMYKRTRWSDEE
jgi:hypothetical protein